MRRPRRKDIRRTYGGTVLGSASADEGLVKTYLDAPHMAVRASSQWVVLEIRTRASSEDFRDGMEMCLHALDVTQSTRLLMDLRKMRLVLVEDERWLAQDFLPRIGKTALKRMAVVTPENELARVIVADLAKPRPTGTQSKHCGTVEEARRWLSGSGEL
jgi:SpoIIAA-like